MKRMLVLVCALFIFMSGMVFAAGGSQAGQSQAAGPAYTEAELRNFKIDANQIPASKKSTTLSLGASIR